MALPVDLRFLLSDGQDNPSSMVIHIPNTATLAEAVAEGQNAAPIIDALTEDKMTGIDIVYHVDISGLSLKASAASDADNEDGAKFVFTDADGRIYTTRIPAIDHTYVLPNSKDLDTTPAGPVDAFIQEILSGGAVASAPVTKADTDITTFKSAKQSFSKNRKGRRR